MTNQLNIFLLIFGALQGCLLSILYLRKKRAGPFNLYFSAFLIVLGLQLTLKVVSKGWLMHHLNFAYLFSYDLPYLVGPLLYLFIKSRKATSHFRWIDLLHFTPFLIAVIATVLLARVYTYHYRFPLYTQAFFELVSIFSYTILSLRISDASAKGFIRLVCLVETVIIIALALMVSFYGRFPDVRLLFTALTFLIYWISYKVITKPDWADDLSTSRIVPMVLQKNSKYSNSGLKSDDASRIESRLHELMTVNKLYLDPELTVETVASALNTSKHNLSQVLNERLHKTYLNYVADLRLDEARKRLADPRNHRYTIAAIAQDSGFNSVSSFNTLFKKRFGVTPSKLREELNSSDALRVSRKS